MSLLDPIVPFLGPVGQTLLASDMIVVGLAALGLVSIILYKVKASIFETSKAWAASTLVLSVITILFRGMGFPNATSSLCGCNWFADPATGDTSQLVPITYLLITGSFFAILYNFNIPLLKKFKWIVSIPLSIPLALASSVVFPLPGVAATPSWVFLEILLLAPIGAIYSSFVYERAVLHMGDYRARMRRFMESTEKSKKAGAELPPEKGGFIYFVYGLMGRRIAKILPRFNSLKGVLTQAGMRVGHKAYVSLMIFSAMLGGGISFFVWFVLLGLGLGSLIGIDFAGIGILFTVIAAMLLAVLTGAVILGMFYMIPMMKIGSRRQRLDQFLPFTSSYMTVLASAGVTPERILRSTAEKDPKFMLSDEISQVIGRIDLLGYDVINAMNAEVDRSPSTAYQDLLRGFAGVIRTGGDLKKFFGGITDHFFQKRALQVQSFLDTLGIIAETYVLMLIAFPLMLVVMLSIMASIGGSLGGIDVFSFMYLLAFILIPICGVMFLFILDSMQPKG